MDPPNPEAPKAKRKKRNRASLKPDPGLPDFGSSSTTPRTVGFGITAPPPQGSRVQVERFVQVVETLNDHIAFRLRSAPAQSAEIDLNVSELRYRPPEVEVAEAIARGTQLENFNEMTTEELMNRVQIPEFEQLCQKETEAPLLAMEHIKFVRSAISKVRAKHVNYLATAIEEEKPPFRQLEGNDVLLSVSFYPPHSTAQVQEFLVLSSQLLTTLKDLFYCVQDQTPKKEAAASSNSMDEDKPTSGYFFINGTFYNDTRHANNSDYATSTMNWMESGVSSFWASQPPEAAVMEHTLFQDLSIQIGKKYLYCHRGQCEHAVVFTAIREFTDLDDRNANVYPKQIYQSKYKQRRCTICDKTVAKWITINDSFSIEDPSYYCNDCFDMAHRNEDGSIIESGFKLLPYLHD